MKLQSGIDADSRYDEKRAKLAKLFLPIVKVTLRHMTKISEESEEGRLPPFSTTMLLMINVWALRTTFSLKIVANQFVSDLSNDDFVYFLQLLLAIVAIFQYRPDVIMSRSGSNLE